MWKNSAEILIASLNHIKKSVSTSEDPVSDKITDVMKQKKRFSTSLFMTPGELLLTNALQLIDCNIIQKFTL